MVQYRSKLDAIAKLRTRARDAQRARVADALQAEAALDDKLAQIDREFTATRESQRESRGGTIDPRAVLDIERYESLLMNEALQVQGQKQAVRQELEKRMGELATAEQELKVIEKIDDRRRERFEQDVAKREQRELDEIATGQFLRLRALTTTREEHS